MFALLRQLFALRNLFAAEADRLVLWLPVPMMAGVAAYFSLASEPPAWVALPPLCLSAALLKGWRGRPWRWVLMSLFLACLGFAAGQLRTVLCYTPLVAGELHNRTVEGTVDEIDRQEKGVRLILSQATVEGLKPEETPVRLRVSFRAYDPAWRVGDRVRVRATLYPPPQPAMPGGYDFAQHMYFLQVGGSGFAMRPPEVIARAKHSGFEQWITQLRHAIADDMRTRIPGPSGAIAAAMTVGEENAIPQETNDIMRDAGIYHVISISGLHMALAAGIVFFAVRLLLVVYPPIGLRVNAKKIAAACALVSAFAYLLLAGAPVPAQRSFVMVAFVFMAMLVDRQGISLYALAWAACAILLLFPDSMTGASFQMSFAATLSILAFYERFGHLIYKKDAGWLMRGWVAFVGIALTSLVATLATAPFVIHHFNRLSTWGILANMAVIPLTSFIIMPGVVLAFVLLPFGAQAPAYWLVGIGSDWMMWCAKLVASLPYATVPLYSLTGWGFGLAVLGLLWLCLWHTRLRLLGVLMLVCGLGTMALHRSPDVFVSGDARQVMVRTPEGRYVLLKGGSRSFTVQAWLRSEKQPAAAGRREAGVECDRTMCRYRGVVALKKPQEVVEQACAQPAEVMIAWWYLHREECPGPKVLIGRTELEIHGAHTLWFAPEGMRVLRAWEEGRGGRPWQYVPEVDEEEEED